jgi:Ni/Co efflux regulator RcnB
MKRLILILATAACVAGPIVASASLAQAQNRDRREDRWDRREDRADRREDRRDSRCDDGRWDRREDRRDRREDRWDRREDRWDRQRHNGYYYRDQWHWGPPPQAYYSDPYFRPGYSSWRRGVTLPGYYRGYVVNDYNRYRLRPPPRGYAWYRVGDDYLLAAIATGLILEAITR